MNAGRTILAVLAGVAAGAAIGVLFAPDKGSDTRKKISKKGEDLATDLAGKVDLKFDELLAAVSRKAKKTAKQHQGVNQG
jgi:gas vesicle protein